MAQLKDCNPQVQVLPVRGNVETRLAKAESDEYDGVILAAAGLVRLGLAERVSEYLSVEQFVPPPGQGVLAVEMRVDDDRMREILARVDHSASRSAAIAERGQSQTHQQPSSRGPAQGLQPPGAGVAGTG